MEVPRFKRMFIAVGTSLNGFMLGCHKMLFVNAAHLGGPCKGTMFAKVTIDVDNHLFNVAHTIVVAENNDEWLLFMTELHRSLGGMYLLIMSIETKVYCMLC
uniref:Uncharacterized protein n=1 Tax=Opuntia streptacantha TaxID=393608 RepID=A0A7C8YNC1_OPUST